MIKNIVPWIVLSTVVSIVIALIAIFLFRRERLKRKIFQEKHYDKCLELKKAEAKVITFIAARNALTYLNRVLPYRGYPRERELYDFYVKALKEVIEKATSFGDLIIVFSSFENDNEKDLALWNSVKKAMPNALDKMETIVSTEVHRLQGYCESSISEEQRKGIYLNAENLHGFILKGFTASTRNSPLEDKIKVLKRSFENKKIIIPKD